MKTKISLLFASAALLMTIGCSKKNSSDLPPQNLQGYWVGLYGVPNGYPQITYNFLFRANGSVRLYVGSTDTAQAEIAEGIYQLQGTSIVVTYTYLNSTSSWSVTATVNSQFTFIQGTWENAGTPTDGGTFFAVRQL